MYGSPLRALRYSTRCGQCTLHTQIHSTLHQINVCHCAIVLGCCIVDFQIKRCTRTHTQRERKSHFVFELNLLFMRVRSPRGWVVCGAYCVSARVFARSVATTLPSYHIAGCCRVSQYCRRSLQYCFAVSRKYTS